MDIEFDPEKNERNIRDRSLSFARAVEFDFATARFHEDTRRDYPEERVIAIGYLDNRLHVLVFPKRRTASGSSVSGRPIEEKEQGMVSRLPEIDEDGEVGDLSKVAPALFRTFDELPRPLKAKLIGRPRKETPKKAVKLRLDADVLDALRKSGSGWQTRINATLRASLALAGKVK